MGVCLVGESGREWRIIMGAGPSKERAKSKKIVVNSASGAENGVSGVDEVYVPQRRATIDQNFKGDTNADSDANTSRRKGRGSLAMAPGKGGGPRAGRQSVNEFSTKKRGTSSNSLGVEGGFGGVPGTDEPTILCGKYSRVGNPTVHANEDRATVVLDLLSKFEPSDVDYNGDDSKQVSFFGVYDGHGGYTCAEALKQQLHRRMARVIYADNFDESMSDNITKTYVETEEALFLNSSPGACCTTSILKGRQLYTGNCGDAMAMVLEVDPDRRRLQKKPIRLNDRHAVYLSPQEAMRLQRAGQEVSQQPGIEDALVSRDEGTGDIFKAIYPSRSFGDADFKKRTRPTRGLIADPTGRGVGHEGPAVMLDGPGPFMLIVGCDGLWDFMEDDDITRVVTQMCNESPSAIAEKLVRTAQGREFQSDDDVTVIVARITYDNE